ncbi:MAG TPA: glycosyltransferase [Clostridiaceae bacterium]|nr:glycosyltransferase [Clostridiaceae bacterium]
MEKGEYQAKKKVLIVYTEMILGGATNSLISMLNSFDYSKYDVELLLYENKGILQDKIPTGVTILEQAKICRSIFSDIAKKLLSPFYIYSVLKSFYYKIKTKNKLVRIQIMSAAGASLSRRLEKEYDIAISYLEFWPLNYTAHFVKAKHKIAWIHIDYLQSGLLVRLDEPAFSKIHRIVFVSRQCLNNFARLCPKYARKAVYIENIMLQEQIQMAAKHNGLLLPPRNENVMRLVSTCRISFSQKGLDRGVKAFGVLRDKGLINNVEWYIIGDGEDMPVLRKMIEDEKLEKHIILLGSKVNPLGYVSECDFFFLPSLYEGKPLAVTEALMLGLPALVTNYASASEQIENYVDGLIVENSVQGIIEGLEILINNPGLREQMKKAVASKDYSNVEAVKQLEKVLEELVPEELQ